VTEGRQEQPAASLRLFVAVELPETWLAALRALQDQLRDRLEPGVRLRWVRPEGIHLTLKFIGQVPAGLRPQIETALAAAVPAPPAISIELGELGTFGERSAVRVVWVGLRGEIERLRELARRVDAAVNTTGIPLEKRPLAPHLTLARVPDGLAASGAASLAAAIAAAESQSLAPFEIEDVSLMLSHLGPAGASFERLAAFPLRPRVEGGDQAFHAT
jgi:2'-5' RNA ligase